MTGALQDLPVSGNRTASGRAATRALFIHSGNLFGGIETALVSLAHAALRQSSFHAAFALCFDEGRVAEELRSAGAVVHHLGATRLSRPWSTWQARRRLRRLLVSSPVDVCIMPSTWTHGIFAPVVRERGIPLTVWAHDRWERTRPLDRWALHHRPDLIIANSQYTADGMTDAFPGAPTRVVYCPLDEPPAAPNRRAEIRRELNTPGEAVVIVQVARLEPYKGHRLLIDALGRLPATVDWRCWFVGGAQRPSESAYLQELRSAVEAAGITHRVQFVGAREDVGQVLQAADIFCHPNLGPEPFGLAFVEALRAGLPVIGTALGGVPEIVTPECGRLVQAGDVAGLTAVLKELLESAPLRTILGAAGPARASALCDADRRLADIADAVSSLVADV